MTNTLSHINADGTPTMVAVDTKPATLRTATAEARLVLPGEVIAHLTPGDSDDPVGPKGAIFQTAILAGIMAAKKTGDLIPLCHLIPLEHCAVKLQFAEPDVIQIRCTARATHKTGVEMEALTGASIAALTVYDMCKALSHQIVIREIRLLAKQGGKRDFGKPRP